MCKMGRLGRPEGGSPSCEMGSSRVPGRGSRPRPSPLPSSEMAPSCAAGGGTDETLTLAPEAVAKLRVLADGSEISKVWKIFSPGQRRLPQAAGCSSATHQRGVARSRCRRRTARSHHRQRKRRGSRRDRRITGRLRRRSIPLHGPQQRHSSDSSFGVAVRGGV